MATTALASSGISASANFGTTYYVALALTGISWETTEANTQITYRVPGVFSSIYAKITDNSINGTSTLRLRKNGANGNQVVSIGNSATGEFVDATVTNIDTIVSGDKVNYSLVTGGSSGSINIRHFITNFTGTNTYAQYASINQTAQVLNTNNYWGLAGSIGNNNTTETRASSELNSGNITFQNLFVYVSANSVALDSTVAFRDDTSSVISVSITASTTGIFEETATSIKPATGSLINFLSTTANNGTSITWEVISIGASSSDSAYFSPTDDSNGAAVSVSPNYFNISGKGTGDTTSPSIYQRSLRIPAYASSIELNVSANTADAASTFAFQITNADTGLSASITASGTGNFRDTSKVVTVLSTDQVNYLLTRGGTGTVTARSMCCMLTNTAFTLANMQTHFYRSQGFQ